jgi:hypothetical protein
MRGTLRARPHFLLARACHSLPRLVREREIKRERGRGERRESEKE